MEQPWKKGSILIIMVTIVVITTLIVDSKEECLRDSLGHSLLIRVA